jgi:hypothetical protein
LDVLELQDSPHHFVDVPDPIFVLGLLFLLQERKA